MPEKRPGERGAVAPGPSPQKEPVTPFRLITGGEGWRELWVNETTSSPYYQERK